MIFGMFLVIDSSERRGGFPFLDLKTIFFSKKNEKQFIDKEIIKCRK
jgi:hypothetical protein